MNQGRRIAVIGVGNEFRGDDAAGVIAARKFEKKNLPGVKTILASGEGAALIEAWQNTDLAVIIDACQTGSPAGKIFCFDALKQKLPKSFFHYSTHAFSVAEAVELARALERLPPRLLVYAIEGKTFETGAGLSPEVRRSVEKLLDTIADALF